MPNPRAQQFKPIPQPIPLILPLHPIPYTQLPFGTRVTLTRLEEMLSKIEPSSFSDDEINLLAYVVVTREMAFAFDFSEKGYFSREYYPDYEIPTIEHTPWQRPPIRIPKALEQLVIDEINSQEKAGRFEPTTSSYRSALFAVAKKKGVRLVVNLEELNAVTVQDASLPPNVNEFAEDFLGYAIYGLFDLFSGFDARWVAESSRPLQAFHSPAGAKQQCTLVQGYTNALQEFQRDTSHALDNVKSFARNFVDDCGLKGPKSRYNDETIPGNSKIRRFFYEYVQNLDLLLGAFINAGITASGSKAILAAFQLKIVGTVVALEGWIIEPNVVGKVRKWKKPTSVSEVRQFLGLAGVGRRWIKGFALIAKPLTVLLHTNTEHEFQFTGEAEEAMNELVDRITTAPVLIKVDYDIACAISRKGRKTDEGMVVVGVDASWIGAGWALYQVRDGQKKPAIYGSCTFGDREQNYGQPKSEVYGVFRALKELRHRVWGVHFRLDHDAKSLVQMLREPDDVPNAPILRWIAWIRLFDFELFHVAADKHRVEDALSRRGYDGEEQIETKEDVDTFIDGFIENVYRRETIPTDATLLSTTKYLFDSLLANYSSSSGTVWAPEDVVPSITASAAINVENDVLELRKLTIDGREVRQIPDFRHRKVISFEMGSSPGDEDREIEVTIFNSYLGRDDPNNSLDVYSGSHEFKILDESDGIFWAEVRVFLKDGMIPVRCDTDKAKIRFRKQALRFFLHDDRVWLKPKKQKSSLPRLVVESISRRGELMASAHNETGHRGRDATYRHLADRFFWPNMYDSVSYFVRSCIECQKLTRPIPVIPYNERWQAPLLRKFDLDCIHMPTGIGGVEYIVQAIEPSILWTEAEAIKRLKSAKIAKFIFETLICRFACVPILTIDGGSEFKGEVEELLREQYNCLVIISTAYHPQGNSVVERAHQPLVAAIFKCTGDAKGSWPLYLQPALFAIRITVSRATGYSPYYLLYGIHPILAFDISEATWQTLAWDMVKSHEDLVALRILQLKRREPEAKKAISKIRESRKRAIEDWERRQNFTSDFHEFEPGMYVWLRESRLDEVKGGKGEWTYSGPYIIHEKRPTGSYVLKELSGAILKGHVHAQRLRLFFYRPDNQTLRSSIPSTPAKIIPKTTQLSI